MSNSLAIAAVTATLRNLIEQGFNEDPDLSGTEVTARPPDKADDNISGNQINLFLYQTTINAALRNMDMPRQIKPGETGQPPLALNLYYLVTAYGRENRKDAEVFRHRLLGRAMSILHDHPLLGPAEIKAALNGNDLHEQIERVRITPQPLSLEDMSKLWTTFQTQYRLSVAYQVAVVLIESTRPTRTPLPVLTQGPADQGPVAQSDLTPPFPTLTAVQPPNQQPSARLGEVLTLTGHHLDGDSVVVRFMNPRLAEPIELVPAAGSTATGLSVQIPATQPDQWVAGFYTLAVVVKRSGEPDRTTNELPFSLAPRIVDHIVEPIQNGVRIRVTCRPEILPEQRVVLLLGDREIPSRPHENHNDRLRFRVIPAVPGDYFIRLRVDGVDSLLVNRAVTPPVFDQSQKVTIP